MRLPSFNVHTRGLPRALVLVTCSLLFLSACSSPDPVPSATWVLRDSADVVDIDVPEGWVRLDPAKGETAANLKIVSPSREHRESISVMYHSHESLSFVYGYSGPFFGPDTLEDDLHAYRDRMREDWGYGFSFLYGYVSFAGSGDRRVSCGGIFWPVPP